MTKRPFLLLLCAALALAGVCSAGPSSANEAEAHVFIKMLAFAPETQTVRDNLISYTDYHAVVAARPGAVWPKSVEEWQTLSSSKDKGAGLFIAALNGVRDLSNIARFYFTLATGMQDRTGIDLSSVERDLYLSTPPQDMLVLAGNFDADAIAQAYQKRAYAKNDLKGLTMWCGPAGCDQGQKYDLKAVDPLDPFGGNLGRQQPVVVAPGYVLSSPNLQALTDAVAAYQSGSSLAKAPDYLALAESVTQTGTLLQATFIPTKPVPDASAIVSTLPPYTLAGFAHTVDGDNVITYVALVYDKEEDAKAAAAEFPTRFAQSPSLAYRDKDFADLLKDRNITLDAARIYASQTTGKFVMLLPLRSPIESAEPVDGQFVPSGAAYRLLVDALTRRDILWLVPKAAPK